jgi:hypothetical protein
MVNICNNILFLTHHVTPRAQWLRYCATNQKVSGSIPDVVIGIFHWHKFFWSHYGPGVDSASNRNEYQDYFLGGKFGRCVRLTTLPTSCAVVKKSGNLNFLEPSGPFQTCNGTALPNLGTLTSWNPLGHPRPIRGLLYLLHLIKFFFFLISNFHSVLNVICCLLVNYPASELYMPTFRNTLFHLHRQVGLNTYLWRWNRQSVPKYRFIKFRHREITQKKEYIKFFVIRKCPKSNYPFHE